MILYIILVQYNKPDLSRVTQQGWGEENLTAQILVSTSSQTIFLKFHQRMGEQDNILTHLLKPLLERTV